MKSRIYAALVSASLCTTAAAQAPTPYGYGPGPGARPAPHSMPSRGHMAYTEADSPDQQLRDGVNKLLGFMRRAQAPSADELAVFLDAEIAPFFDFDYMANVAVGSASRVMSKERRTQLADTLKQRFLGTLAERLGSFDDQEIKYLASRVNADGRTGTASIAVVYPKSYPARIDFRFYRRDGDWKVYDVVANGQSAVAHYRRELRQMRRGGSVRRGPMSRTGVPRHPRLGGYR